MQSRKETLNYLQLYEKGKGKYNIIIYIKIDRRFFVKHCDLMSIAWISEAKFISFLKLLVVQNKGDLKKCGNKERIIKVIQF